NGFVRSESFPLPPRLCEGRFVEIRAGEGDRLFVSFHHPRTTDAELFAQSLGARKQTYCRLGLARMSQHRGDPADAVADLHRLLDVAEESVDLERHRDRFA